MEIISRMEEVLLLAVWKLQQDAYGLAIRQHVSELLGKELSVGAVYIPLERLAKRGFLQTRESEPTAIRGGRRKRFYTLTQEGMNALVTVKKIHETAWGELPDISLEY